MNKKSKTNKIIYILIILLLIEGISVFFIYNKYSVKETFAQANEFDSIYKNIAILIEQSDGTYKESATNVWPVNMVFDKAKSGCVDVFGNTLKDSLIFDENTNIASVIVTDTVYCYLYFNNP